MKEQLPSPDSTNLLHQTLGEFAMGVSVDKSGIPERMQEIAPVFSVMETAPEPVKDKMHAIYKEDLYPHYRDERFMSSKEHAVYVGSDVSMTRNGKEVEGAFYNYSDRLEHLSSEEEDKLAEETGFNRNSPAFFEAYLQKIYKDPSVELVHMIVGVNPSNTIPYHIYGTFSETNPRPERKQ